MPDVSLHLRYCTVRFIVKSLNSKDITASIGVHPSVWWLSFTPSCTHMHLSCPLGCLLVFFGVSLGFNPVAWRYDGHLAWKQPIEFVKCEEERIIRSPLVSKCQEPSADTSKQTNSVALSPRANYTDWATATCRRNSVPTFADRGVSRGQRCRSPTVVNLTFLDRSR
jgi:hypothetical protein